MTTMKKEKITRDDIRVIAEGETKTFELGTIGACESGRVTAYTMQSHLGCKFHVQTDYANKTLTVTRRAL